MLKSILSFFSNYPFSTMSYQQRQIEKYLANSSDLVDLERRQRELTHGRFKL